MYSDYFQNMNMDNTITGNYNTINQEMDVDVNMNAYPQNTNAGCPMGAQERVINRTFVHEVPHVCPIHTRIINHHVFKHIYRPAYTCSEENVCSNVQCGSCSQFQ